MVGADEDDDDDVGSLLSVLNGILKTWSVPGVNFADSRRDTRASARLRASRSVRRASSVSFSFSDCVLSSFCAVLSISTTWSCLLDLWLIVPFGGLGRSVSERRSMGCTCAPESSLAFVRSAGPSGFSGKGCCGGGAGGSTEYRVLTSKVRLGDISFCEGGGGRLLSPVTAAAYSSE